MNIGNFFKKSFDINLEHLPRLVLYALVVLLISFLSFGILAPIMLAGYLMCYLKLYRGEEANFGLLFKYFDRFLPLFLFGLVFGIIIFLINLIHPYLTILAVWILFTLWLYTVLIIAENKDITVFEAMNVSQKKVFEKGFWNHFVFILILSILIYLGYRCFILGILLTFPIAMGAISAAYIENFSGSTL